MRPTITRPLRWPQSLSKRCITTKPASWANIKYELENRPPRIYYDYLTPTKSHLLNISLPLLPPSTPSGSPTTLPQGHHLVYFPPDHPTTTLLPDGTDADHSPGPPFTRRVWAKGRLVFNAAPNAPRLLLDGSRAVCVEHILRSRLTGAPPRSDGPPGTGEKVFVQIVRLYGGAKLVEAVERGDTVDWARFGKGELNEEVAVVERRTLCFMTPKTAEEAKLDVDEPYRRIVQAPSSRTPMHTTTLTATAPLLFRFSALTFNAHAIHLDRHHCRTVEGYPAPLVHGPLLVSLLLRALRDAGVGDICWLKYTINAPVYVDEEISLHIGPQNDGVLDVWVTAGEMKRLCVTGRASLKPSVEH